MFFLNAAKSAKFDARELMMFYSTLPADKPARIYKATRVINGRRVVVNRVVNIDVESTITHSIDFLIILWWKVWIAFSIFKIEY